jgi:RNA recognition motif-containing protein
VYISLGLTNTDTGERCRRRGGRAVAATADDAVQASSGQEQGKVSGEKGEGQRLYIGNIPWSLDAHEATAAVQALCADAGVAATSVTVPWLDKKRKKLQKHRGYAFVQLTGEADAADCVAGLAGAALEGAELKVNVATPPPPPRPLAPKPQGRQHVKVRLSTHVVSLVQGPPPPQPCVRAPCGVWVRVMVAAVRG